MFHSVVREHVKPEIGRRRGAELMAMLQPEEHLQLRQGKPRPPKPPVSEDSRSEAAWTNGATSVDVRLMHAFGLATPHGFSYPCDLASGPPGLCLAAPIPSDWCDDVSTDVGGEISEVHSEVSDTFSRDIDARGKVLLGSTADKASPTDTNWQGQSKFLIAPSVYWEDPTYTCWSSMAGCCDSRASDGWGQGMW